jgi:hypothetical protein
VRRRAQRAARHGAATGRQQGRPRPAALRPQHRQPAGHFPQDGRGEFPGHYPGDSEAVVDQLEQLCERGFTHLVLPATASWWLEHYTGLARYLDGTAEQVVDEPCGVAFRLRARRPAEVGA